MDREITVGGIQFGVVNFLCVFLDREIIRSTLDHCKLEMSRTDLFLIRVLCSREMNWCCAFCLEQILDGWHKLFLGFISSSLTTIQFPMDGEHQIVESLAIPYWFLAARVTGPDFINKKMFWGRKEAYFVITCTTSKQSCSRRMYHCQW